MQVRLHHLWSFMARILLKRYVKLIRLRFTIIVVFHWTCDLSSPRETFFASGDFSATKSNQAGSAFVVQWLARLTKNLQPNWNPVHSVCSLPTCSSFLYRKTHKLGAYGNLRKTTCGNVCLTCCSGVLPTANSWTREMEMSQETK